MTEIHLNDIIWVKFTDAGLEWANRVKRERLAQYNIREQPIQLNDEGFYVTGLWCFMSDYGAHVCAGMDSPFTMLFDVPQSKGVTTSAEAPTSRIRKLRL